MTNYAGDDAWFMQYGDSVNRWALWAHLDDTNRLLLSWDRDSTTLTTSSVVVQANHDGNYHEFALEQTGGTRTAIVLFDSQPVGELLPVAATSAIPHRVHWGTFSTNGMVKSHWQLIDFALGNFSVSSAGLDVSNRFQLGFSSRTNRPYGVFCSTNFLDWSALSTNVAGNGTEVSFTDTNALRSIAPMPYRIRVNP